MIEVGEARSRAAALLARACREWAADPAVAGDARLTVVVHPPTEREALAELAAVRRWRDDWDALHQTGLPGVDVTWSSRSWPSVGKQTVPTRVEVVGADAIAAFAGDRHWSVMRDRAATIRRRLGDTDAVRTAIRTHIGRLADYEEHRFSEVVDVAAWLAQNPATGFRPRQVPVRGVDSKWLGTHRAVVTALVSAATGEDELGLVDADPLIRIRVLDDALQPEGPRDFAASSAELTALAFAPATVLVLENLETLLALPPLPGVVAAHGSGFAVGALAGVPWVQQARVLYWGDLDSNGFAILHAFRSRLPGVQSVLMDVDTLYEHRDLWVAEPKAARGVYSTLDAQESEALQALRDAGDARLEQERIPWNFALAAIRRALPPRPSAR